MAADKATGLDRILGKVADLDKTNLEILVKRLVRDRKLLESVFNTIRDGILVVDPDGLIQYANRAAFALLGLRSREIGRQTIWKRLPDLAQTLGVDPSKAESVPESSSCEIRIAYPEVRFLQVYFVAIDVNLGTRGQGGSAVVFSDITEAKHSTEELIENEKVASIMMLAAGVAHELGNPLNSLTIHLQILQRRLGEIADTAPADRMKRSLEICSREVTRLDEIISHFLAAIRPRQPDLRPVDLFRVLEEVLEVEENLFTERRVEVSIDVSGRPPSIAGDPDLIKQVFFNVLKNATEAMPGGGRIHIRWRRDKEAAYLLFADTGVGIQAEDLAKVFQPYYTTKESGTGLGMMIVQRIMRDHGGQIAIDSRPGDGTVVTLRFPLENPENLLLEEDSPD